MEQSEPAEWLTSDAAPAGHGAETAEHVGPAAGRAHAVALQPQRLHPGRVRQGELERPGGAAALAGAAGRLLLQVENLPGSLQLGGL